MPRARGARSPVFVTIGTLKYGFQASSTSSTYAAELGHTPFVAQAGVFFGANAPKPARATKEFTTTIVGSFCDDSKIATLKTTGWTVTQSGIRRGLKRSGRVRTVFIDMGTYNYAWNITVDDVDLAADLGFELAVGSTPNMVWGSTPKPPRATRRTLTGSESTFMKPTTAVANAAAAAGWTVSDKYNLIPDL
ncbi:MAG: hypothetical protein KME11_03095 [Timaviella obliquedivisa GSE-PSE-MK23-08B]|jgi:hypothetical protein|nr:hypothetical protein [Timaviella obliquedivisa GSE-PSE-MK23-08B]MBW4514194.1 hypothetical protein [Timaviella obliquedivisa GSE-PSE-MK23-08B]